MTQPDVPADTDKYIYRYVTKFRDDGTGGPVVESVLTQIWISQP